MVIGYDNKQVFVRHGGLYLKINPRNLQHIKNSKEVQRPEEVECRSEIDSKRQERNNANQLWLRGHDRIG